MKSSFKWWTADDAGHPTPYERRLRREPWAYDLLSSWLLVRFSQLRQTGTVSRIGTTRSHEAGASSRSEEIEEIFLIRSDLEWDGELGSFEVMALGRAADYADCLGRHVVGVRYLCQHRQARKGRPEAKPPAGLASSRCRLRLAAEAPASCRRG
jgi:hypothetical protein